ncbi:ANTAR domain-containing protein [Klenkia marina]|uniref:ANTAR domain-containing protein n=1 Tax=Klenkia marina TaxID=1960309 RepID=A0A1G4YL68_9ACTN|nr:ANTAR domain-containing protein [Klenkia marina]SCX54240.1 ANTAR domain-containing protein [Klenkia marina]
MSSPSLADRLATALAGRSDDDHVPDLLAAACLDVLPVDGAGVTVSFGTDQRMPVGCSDADSQAAELLQFTLGDGPCLQAHRSRSLVVATAADLARRWPVYWVELAAHTPFRSVVAVPLRGATTAALAVDLYWRDGDGARSVSPGALAEWAAALETVTAADLGDSTGPEDRDAGLATWLDTPAVQDRLTVWQAVGCLRMRDGLTSSDALAQLRARAFASGQDLERAATAVLAGHPAPVDPAPLSRRPTDLTGRPLDEPITPGSGTSTVPELAGTRHRLVTHPTSADPSAHPARGVRTSLPRGPHPGHDLACGRCDLVLARDHVPTLLPSSTPRLRCRRCGALNDPTAEAARP